MNLDDIKRLSRRIILFGAVDNGRIEFILESGVDVERILDNDEKKRGRYYKEIIVESAKVLIDEDFSDAFFIIMPERHVDDIVEQIVSSGVTDYVVAASDIEEFCDPFIMARERGYLSGPLLPRVLNVELSGVCNLECVYCPFHGYINLKKEKGLMSWGVLKSIVKQVERIDTIETLSVVGAGEVFLHPNWYEMSKYLIEKLCINEFYIYTNGMLLGEENIDKLHRLTNVKTHLEISIDGICPEECDEFRRGSSYEHIRSNVRRAISVLEGQGVDITIFNLIPAIEEDISKTGFLIDQRNDPPLFLKKDFPEVQILSRKPNLDYKIVGDIPGFHRVEVRKKKPFPICWNVFERMAINYKGALLRCSCGGAGIVEIADLNNDLLDVWQNDIQMQIARKNILEESERKDFCYGCELKGKDPYYVLVRD